MGFDPAIQKLLDLVYAADSVPLHHLAPDVARAQYDETHSIFDMPLPEVAKAEDKLISGPGGEIPLRIYHPLDAVKGSLLPVLVYFHGGGWLIGSIKTHDRLCRYLANAAKAVVVSVDYRLAPEDKFPAGFDDCVAAVNWVAKNASQIGADARQLAVGGDSAGGNLAAAVTHWCRDHHGPAIAYQMLFYPVTDPLGTHHLSRNRYATGLILEEDMIDWFLGLYVNSPEESADTRVSPLRAENFIGLPPAFVLNAALDPLCDEGRAYADKLRAAGVPVIYRCHETMIHGFLTMGGLIPDALPALDEAAQAFREAVLSSLK
jgi:acetyl esterase